MWQLAENQMYDMTYTQPFLDELTHISFHVLEHKIELIVFANDFLQFHDVHMIQLPQRLVHACTHTHTHTHAHTQHRVIFKAQLY